jgi:hypothetical protein
MEDFRISRRQGLIALGATVGSALLGTGVAKAASAFPGVQLNHRRRPSARSTAVLGTPYSLTVQNNSINPFDFCLYQEDPAIGNPHIMSLAWLTQSLYPSGSVTWDWDIEYSFLWSQTGQLKPGIQFKTSQIWPADPNVVGVSGPAKAGNQIGLSKPKPNVYNFTSTPTKNAQLGTLYVAQDSTIPLLEASVGIGMKGFGTFAVQAQPNLHNNFTPHPVYYLAAGQFNQGEVLDIGAITDSVNIEFGPGVFDLTATLNLDNTWTVAPTKSF